MFSARHLHLGGEDIFDTAISFEEIIKYFNSAKDGLALNDDFLGLMPLNDVASSGHELELGSTPLLAEAERGT